MISMPKCSLMCKSILRRTCEIQSVQWQALSTLLSSKHEYKNALRDFQDERCLPSGYHRQLHRYNNSRHFSITNSISSQVAEKTKPGISVLGKLRKRTGYSLSLCK